VVALLHIVLINANHVNLNGSRSFRVAEMVQCSVEIAGNTKEAIVDNNGLNKGMSGRPIRRRELHKKGAQRERARRWWVS